MKKRGTPFLSDSQTLPTLHDGIGFTDAIGKGVQEMISFLASGTGRLTRIVAGLILIALGWWMHSTTGTVIAVIGLIPLLAGLFDICLFAPLFGLPLSGKQIRSR